MQVISNPVSGILCYREGESMEERVEISLNSMNSISDGTVLYRQGDAVESIGLLVKGRVELTANGVCMVLGSGNFLGICDVATGTHGFTYTAKDDAVVYVLSVKGTASVENLLRMKQEYCGLLVTSLNFFIVELNKRVKQLQAENREIFEFMKQKYVLCDEVGKTLGFDVETKNSLEKITRYLSSDMELSDKLEYYLQSGSLPMEAQKKYFGGSAYISFFHYNEQCQVVHSLVKACEFYGECMYKFFRGMVMDEDSLFHVIGRLALGMMEKGARNPMIDHAVDEIVEKINDTERFLVEKLGMDISLDRDRMERLYFALLSGESSVEDEMEELDTPGVEYLYNSLEQITEYAPVHLKVKSEFISHVETFMTRKDKFEKTSEAMALRKQITAGFFEIYEAIMYRSFEDADMPLAVRLFLDYGFVSEKLLTEEELSLLVSLRPKKDTEGDGCRVYSMRKWLKAIYDGVKETSKNEYDLDFEAHLRQQLKERRIDKKEMADQLADKEKRMHFECQNLFRYADRVVSGNISAFVPILCSDGIFNNIKNAYLTEEKINHAIRRVEKIDYSVFYRDRLASFEKQGVPKATVIDRITPDVILFPIYGKNCIMWQDITGKRRSSKGRFLMPVLFERELENDVVKLMANFRWEKCRTDMGNRWNDFRYPSLTSEYTDYLQFYRKNSELSQERKTKIRAQLQQCNNKHKEVFAKDYVDWIQREASGAMKLSRVARTIMFTYCPLANDVYKGLEAQTVYAEAAKKYIRDNRAERKSVELLIHKFEREGMEVPEEIRQTLEYLKG